MARFGVLRAVRGAGALRGLIGRLGAGWIWLCDRTTRWTVEGAEVRAAIQSGRGRHIAAVWHGRLLIVPAERRRGMNIVGMISNSADGDMIAGAAAAFGAETVRGSAEDPAKPDKDKQGRRALAGALGVFRRHEDLVFVLTPDGPRGPAQECHPGVAFLAAAAGTPVTPFAFSTRSGLFLGSWDRFHLALPFGRGAKVYGAPLPPPADRGEASLAAFTAELQARLNAVTARADQLCGR